MEGYLDNELKTNSSYVKMIVRLVKNKNGTTTERFLPYRFCTKDDWDLFPPVRTENRAQFLTYRNDPNKNLFCLDW